MGNRGFGLYATGLSTGTVVAGNLIAASSAGSVGLSKSRGIVRIR